jgi:hypothetical protein
MLVEFGEGFGHALQAERLQLVEGGMYQHELSPQW